MKGAHGAVTEQRRAGRDEKQATANRTIGDDTRGARGAIGQHQRPAREGEVGDKVIGCAQGQDARPRLGERGHARVLEDERADKQTRLSEARVDRDKRSARAKF